MTTRQTLLQWLFGPGTLDWTDRSYLIDWLVVISIWVFSWIAQKLPVYERPFDLKDPLISNPHGLDTVPSELNHNISLFLPIAIFVLAGCIRGSSMEIHHGSIAVCTARGLARLITVLGKHAIGRLRPDFLARCGYDEVIKLFTGKSDVVLSGRKSFPSGHSSTAFSGMTVLALWIAGMTAAWCFSVPTPPQSLRSSRLGRFSLTLPPLFWATFVAISRVQDYRHHKEDVIAGSIIGITCGAISYFIFWPNPFTWKTFVNSQAGKPRELYIDPEHVGRPDVTFRLTRLEDEIETV